MNLVDLGREKEQIVEAMRNRAFQYSLVDETKVMERVEGYEKVNYEALSLLDLSQKEDTLIAKLNDYKGCIVAAPELCFELYDNYSDKHAHSLSVLISKLTRKFPEDAGIIYTARAVGYGVGVKRYSLSEIGTRLLYFLSNSGVVSEQEIRDYLWGKKTKLSHSIARRKVHDLRASLAQNGSIMEVECKVGAGYRLVRKEPVVNDLVPKI